MYNSFPLKQPVLQCITVFISNNPCSDVQLLRYETIPRKVEYLIIIKISFSSSLKHTFKQVSAIIHIAKTRACQGLPNNVPTLIGVANNVIKLLVRILFNYSKLF